MRQQFSILSLSKIVAASAVLFALISAIGPSGFFYFGYLMIFVLCVGPVLVDTDEATMIHFGGTHVKQIAS